MTYPQGGPGDPYGQQPGGYDPYGQQPYSAQPYSGQPGYDPYAQQQGAYQQPYQQPYQNPYQPRGTNGMAIGALICGLAGIFIAPVVASIVGIILGHLARKKIQETGEEGDGMALAGLITGYIGAGLWILGCGGYLVIVFIFIGASAASSSSYDSGYTFILQSLAAMLG